MNVTLYGLSTCDTCRKALKSLREAGHKVTVTDVRKDGMPQGKLDDFLARFGGDLLNRRSTTWRGLSEAERSEPPRDLLLRHPALMKRPVIETDTSAHLGWTPEIRAALLEG